MHILSLRGLYSFTASLLCDQKIIYSRICVGVKIMRTTVALPAKAQRIQIQAQTKYFYAAAFVTTVVALAYGNMEIFNLSPKTGCNLIFREVRRRIF